MSDINKYPTPTATGSPMVEVVGTAHVVESTAASATLIHSEKMSIPADFTSCSNCQWPGCFGCRASGTCLCYEGYISQCKIIEGMPEACCLCYGGDVECVQPRTCCKGYKQLCCWECFIALPPAEDDYRSAPVGIVDVHKPELLDNIIVAQGLCCIIRSLNCGMPACILDGCYVKDEFLCLSSESVRMKWMCWEKEKKNPDTCCVLFRGQSFLQYPKTCCKGMDHSPCFDSRYACPCDDDVPCVYTFFPCCVCCVNGTCMCGCCATLEQVKYQAKYRGMPPPPQQQPVVAQPAAPQRV